MVWFEGWALFPQTPESDQRNGKREKTNWKRKEKERKGEAGRREAEGREE